MDFNLSELFSGLHEDQLVTYMAVSSAALLLYDYLLTLDDEISLMRPSRWNISKIFFYVTRYLVFPDILLVLYHQLGKNMSTELCKTVYLVSTSMINLGIVIAELALVLRTWALWGRSKIVAALLAILFVGCEVPAAFYIAKYLKSLTFVPINERLPNFSGCLVNLGINETLWVTFVLLAVFEVVLLLFTLATRLHHFGQPVSALASMMYKDGIIYFLYLFAISATNVILFLHASLVVALMLIPLQRVLHAILSSRILLNIRKYSRYEVEASEVLHSRKVADAFVRRFANGTRRDTKGGEFELQVRVGSAVEIEV